MPTIDNTDKPANPEQRRHVLRILTGVHAGASRRLEDQEMILVGSGEDCDIVLADAGVARHHALINLAPDVSSLRALDAPLRLDDQPVQPGDPVALRPLQRIRLGETAIAFGVDEDAGWESLLPGQTGESTARGTRPALRRLPMIAALAVLSLASLAIFAAVMPMSVKTVDTQAELDKLQHDFRIDDSSVETTADGTLVLSGTVKDIATLDRMQARLDAASVDAKLALRTGDKIAGDVREVLRSAEVPIEARTRYLGDGRVEVTGRFTAEQMDALSQISHSRAMVDVAGVTRLVPNDLNGGSRSARTTSGGQKADKVPETTRIVAIVRGEKAKENKAHLVALDGSQYEAGDQVPGLGRLSVIGKTAQTIDAQGMLHEIKVEPVTSAELAMAAEEQAGKDVAARTTAEVAAAIGGSKNETTTAADAGTPAADTDKMVADVKPAAAGKSPPGKRM